VAFDVAVGTSTLPTVTGNFALIDGQAFQPNLVGNVFTQQTAMGYQAGLLAHLAFAASGLAYTTEMVAIDGVSASDTGRARNGTRIVWGSNIAGAMTITMEASVTSFDSDGLTANFLIAPASGFLWPWFALGGDVTAKVVVANTGIIDGGTIDLASAGFGTPACAIITSSDFQSGNTTPGATISVGATDGSSQWSVGYGSQDAALDANVMSTIRDDQVITLPEDTALGSRSVEAVFNSWITDGVRLTVTNAPPSATQVCAVLIKGGNWKVGTDTARTTNGTKTTSGLPFIPQFGLFAGSGTPLINTTYTDANAGRCTIGFVGAGSQRGISWHDVDAAATMQVEQSMYDDRVLRFHNADGGTLGDATITLSGAAGSFDAGWTGVSGTAYPFGYVVGGGTLVGGGGGPAVRSKLTALGVG
jgi:hypothetical protein